MQVSFESRNSMLVVSFHLEVRGFRATCILLKNLWNQNLGTLCLLFIRKVKTNLWWWIYGKYYHYAMFSKLHACEISQKWYSSKYVALWILWWLEQWKCWKYSIKQWQTEMRWCYHWKVDWKKALKYAKAFCFMSFCRFFEKRNSYRNDFIHLLQV